ncbi:hypothetical protein N7495_009971 [Penicillium taxi]|uniref:uncharacterized protein n=1 Tax=Penicillium taxi TaxID=168475 RepID=UPI0025456975|nr:uncharacterized protein N7495_009971 [Penicillium taxi]KAJ5885461.1 hypothetical protein N7495_009971 [Penicillium taxi]
MSRSATVVKTNEPITFPVLTYSDALPRNDLRPIMNNPLSQNHYNFFPQPGAGDGKGPSPNTVSKFDFRLTVPPDEAIPATRRKHNRSPLGQHTIGVALGSPDIANPSAARFRTSISTHRPPKASKWKKIGGLFKAKNGFQAGAQRPPSIRTKQVEENRALSKPLQRKVSTAKTDASAHAAASKGAPKRSGTRSRKVSLSKKPKGNASDEIPLLQSPLLQVDIPDTQMERYSVMFENVIPKNNTPLLARRSKTLGNLKVPNAQQFIATNNPPRRRATSPARTNFSLFPTSQPAKAAQVLGMHNYSRKPSPLKQSSIFQRKSSSQASTDGPQSILESLLDKQSATFFESPTMSNPFSDQQRINTPQSSRIHTPNSISSKDKPLPAIRGQPITIMKASSRHQVNPVVQWEKDYRHNHARNPQNQFLSPPAPPAPIKDSTPPSASSLPLPGEISTGPFFRTMSAELVTIGLGSNKPTSSTKPVEKEAKKQQIPAISLSRSLSIRAEQMAVARSLSVRGARKVLIPVGAKVDHITGDERFVERRAHTPQITDGRYRRQLAMSQELLIESI